MDTDLLKDYITSMPESEFQEIFRFINGEAVDREIAKSNEAVNEFE